MGWLVAYPFDPVLDALDDDEGELMTILVGQLGQVHDDRPTVEGEPAQRLRVRILHLGGRHLVQVDKTINKSVTD